MGKASASNLSVFYHEVRLKKDSSTRLTWLQTRALSRARLVHVDGH